MKLLWAAIALFVSYPVEAQVVDAAKQQRPSASEYRIGGAKALRPSKIWDDGHYTYIEWPVAAELPAVFTRGSDGMEVVAEGIMMGEEYVLDRVHSFLIFRIDRQAATARRQAARHE